MKRKQMICVLCFLSLLGYGQKGVFNNLNIIDESTNKIEKSREVVVNHELIKSVLAYQVDDEYLSFSDVYRELKGAERIDFMRKYLDADLGKESINDIRKRVVNNEQYSFENLKSDAGQLLFNDQNDLGILTNKK